MKVEIYNQLLKKISKERIFINEPMSKHTSFKIGGMADIFIVVDSENELLDILQIAKENKLNITCIGNGTNILVKDNGLRGITIKLNFKKVEITGEEITVGSGVSLPVLAKIAYENGLSGLEFAAGIPGTVGGAIKMNAGAYGYSFSCIVQETTFLDENLEIKTISNELQKFAYRSSIFSNKNDIIISSKIKLKRLDKILIKAKMEENMKKRRETQPIEIPNAGSVFKRNNEYSAAELIDKCGLKGYSIGGATVSQKHAGFIINTNNAKASDVLNLIEHIRKTVSEKYNVNLELEIKVIGE